MKKTIRYLVGIVALIIILLLSFDVKKLDEYKVSHSEKAFSATDYALDVWENKMPAVIKEAPELITLIDKLETDRESASESFGRKLGISSTWYFMARGEGFIDSIRDDYLLVDLNGNLRMQVATSFIFGNAVRDGSGVVDIDEFVNMTDFNNVSVALNHLVKERVIPELKKSALPGMKLDFAGAFELNEETGELDAIRVIPVSAKLSDGEQK
jgi:predicted lipoprotein